jgi:hypothetical protein
MNEAGVNLERSIPRTLKSIRLSFVIGVLCLVHPATAATLDLRFEAQTAEFEAAAAEYRALWATDGARIAHALEIATGLVFNEDRIRVVVFEGVSNSGAPGVAEEPMMMRASYAPEVKKGTLIHELGHRILLEHGIVSRRVGSEQLDSHRLLFLFLYDLWADEYGTRFADANVAVERERKGIYDYDSAWTWALAQSRQERAGKFDDAKSSEELQPSGR